eukprot:7682051-Pyramimonas_sp.AAC.2
MSVELNHPSNKHCGHHSAAPMSVELSSMEECYGRRIRRLSESDQESPSTAWSAFVQPKDRAP